MKKGKSAGGRKMHNNNILSSGKRDGRGYLITWQKSFEWRETVSSSLPPLFLLFEWGTSGRNSDLDLGRGGIFVSLGKGVLRCRYYLISYHSRPAHCPVHSRGRERGYFKFIEEWQCTYTIFIPNRKLRGFSRIWGAYDKWRWSGCWLSGRWSGDDLRAK